MKKGFTLIELLAVIAVIAIILSITTFSVSKIISNSKDSLSSTQKKNVEEAAEAYYLKEGMVNNVSCINVSVLLGKGYIDSKEVKNPKTGESLGGSVEITYEANQYSYEYRESECKICNGVTSETVTAGKIPSGKYEAGDEYVCEVKPGTNYHFFVLNQEGDKINLIMDNNISLTGDIEVAAILEWLSEEDYNLSDGNSYGYSYNDSGNKIGPVTVMKHLLNATSSWTNLENIKNGPVLDDGEQYTSVIFSNSNVVIAGGKGGVPATIINMANPKARLPKKTELEKVGCSVTTSNSCPNWVVSNLNMLGEYWTMTSDTSGRDVFTVSNIGNSKKISKTTIIQHASGIRPVIQVSTSDLK